MEKLKCYEFDFGDTNLITTNINDVTEWIKSDMEELKEGDEGLQYTINVLYLTRKEIDALPEWS